MVSENSIELKNVEFFYKKNVFILKKLSAKILGGRITALLGINGSGKTTLFKILTGLYNPSFGNFYYNNVNINNDTILFYKKELGFMPEFLQLYKDMYVRDVLCFFAELKGYYNINFDEILSTVFLLEHSNKKVKALSKGMKQRLNLAQAIIGNPKVVLFDEPSNGFDCGSITMFYSILRKLADNGTIVLISSHHLTEIYGNVDNVLILSNGVIIKEFDINSFDYDDSFLFKEVYIRIEFLNDVILSLLSKQFPKFNVKNNNIVYGRANNKSILDLILFLLDMQIFIKDIRIDNKILEDMLLNLS
ncbi:ABC transporter ATP-binding protein [Candidatus Azoamicus ciliaticola]|uniref:Vitamin B12 import ATP-binding protein BtuD n=1 Tax=Candidatus Azoamicus ciliaticola TaxID=2652803 RepID=A0A6J5JYN3_9GAMM|nr:ABC transporter ATP-binding protein [Candidatus Azoamicus ciliaticola]CAB3976453.1 Vitamin B12 import ATP-binding protein BtuD [Candidatus Azoamicus ciliaticola]